MIEHKTPGDHFLAWASETESGSWNELRGAAGHLIGLHLVRLRPWMFASRLEELGHMDIDWAMGRWSIATPCLALSAGMGFCAYLAGWRPFALEHRTWRVAEAHRCKVVPVKQDTSPHAIYVCAESLDQLREVARELELPLCLSPPESILAALPEDLLQLGPPAAAPTIDDELKRFDPTTGAWLSVQLRDSPGLYSFDLHGQRAFRFRTHQDWHHVDRATGQLLTMKAREDVMMWHPPNPANTTAATLTVPAGLSLPTLIERIAISSSGLLPSIVRDLRVYSNVEESVALGIANSVGLELHRCSDPFQ